MADTGDYPGRQEIADASGVIAKLLAEKASFGLVGKFLERKDDLLELAENVHELENFYDTQGPAWERLRKASAQFQLNLTWLDKDPTASAALQRIKDILAAPAPYEMIKDAESLIQTVEGVNTALVTKRREHVLQRIDIHIGKVEAELDAAKATADLRNQCLFPLQKLKRPVETQTSIAHVHQAHQGASEAVDEAFDKIEAASKPTEKPGVGEPEPPVYVKNGASCRQPSCRPRAFSKPKPMWMTI